MPGLPRSELAALGFIGLAPVYHKEPKLSAEVIATIVADEWDERVDTITRGFLGLTVACARCHDHKFDPIGTADYYALAGVMASTQLVERPLVPADPAAEETLAGLRAEIVDLELRLGYAKEMKTTAGKQNEDGSKYRPDDRRPGSPDQGVEGDEAVRRPHGARGPRCRPLGRRQRPLLDGARLPAGSVARPPRLPPGQRREPRPDRPAEVPGRPLAGRAQRLRGGERPEGARRRRSSGRRRRSPAGSSSTGSGAGTSAARW